MRENRLYGSEGGGALTRSPYPHRWQRPDAPAETPRFFIGLIVAPGCPTFGACES